MSDSTREITPKRAWEHEVDYRQRCLDEFVSRNLEDFVADGDSGNGNDADDR